jgi:hypothetical protein
LNILEEANELTSSTRAADYGPPHLHHGATAQMVDALLRRAGWSGPKLTARDWQRFIIADKLVRDTHRAQRDNEVDIAGYARCMEKDRDSRPLKVASDLEDQALERVGFLA